MAKTIFKTLFSIMGFCSLTSVVHAETAVIGLDAGRYITSGVYMVHEDPFDVCNYSYEYTAEIRAKQNSTTGASAITWDYIKAFDGDYISPTGSGVYRDVAYVIDRYNDVTYRYDSTWCDSVRLDMDITIGKTVGSSSRNEPYFENVIGKMAGCPNSTSCQDVDTIQLETE